MATQESFIEQTQISSSVPDSVKNVEAESVEPQPTKEETSNVEKNYTDPKVCHDSSLKPEGVARLFTDQHKKMMEDGTDISAVNEHDAILTDAIEYPLIVINDRNIENHEIIKMVIYYDRFLPSIYLEVWDEHENETKLNTTQMGGIIRVCMISPVDKVYKKILVNFKITNVSLNPDDPTVVTYFGEFDVPAFRQVNIGHIWMPTVCPKPITCQQGAHINANTWELLHQIAENTGLGFAATKMTKEIEDRIIRNIFKQRYNEYIVEQLKYSGLGEDNIFDAWVDVYGYIVLVNVKWVMDQNIKPSDLTITHNVGIHPTSNDISDQKPEDTERTLSNFNYMVAKSNAEIESYSVDVNNESVRHGTLETIYKINIGGTKTKLDVTDIQSQQDSIDGTFIEDYNTGKTRPIPRFNFNDDAYTGLSGGYNIDEQKKIRDAYFKKKRQSLLTVTLKDPNFGLQRGTLVNIAIFDNDPVNKKIMFDNVSNIEGIPDDTKTDVINVSDKWPTDELWRDDSAFMPNIKLSGLYYIDGMKWEYTPELGHISQSLTLIKKGITTGYFNRHNPPRIPEQTAKVTIPQSPEIKENQDLI